MRTSQAKRAAIKKIPGFPEYSITRDGHVWSHIRKDSRGHQWGGVWMAPMKNKKYLFVNLSREGKHHHRLIHRLVLETYIGFCPPNKECRHLDGNPKNNALFNLSWGSRRENVQDAIQHGTHNSLCQAKLSDQNRRLIYSVYWGGVYLQQELATHFGVHRRTIGRVVNDKRWAILN